MAVASHHWLVTVVVLACSRNSVILNIAIFFNSLNSLGYYMIQQWIISDIRRSKTLRWWVGGPLGPLLLDIWWPRRIERMNYTTLLTYFTYSSGETLPLEPSASVRDGGMAFPPWLSDSPFQESPSKPSIPLPSFPCQFWVSEEFKPAWSGRCPSKVPSSSVS